MGGMIDLMRRIKTDPNPLGEENFLFINAFNEWGERNTLEPTLQWGDGYLRALDATKQYADDNIPWTPELIEEAEKCVKEVNDNSNRVDVCVIIRDFQGSYPFEQPYTLLQTIQSLQKMERTLTGGASLFEPCRTWTRRKLNLQCKVPMSRDLSPLLFLITS
ncbi:hypothetical protein LZ31DRAFT_43084 [Colletotrichum somersetense]|nr:hypothetical protein LZ31DRAFT_43084 [Colletotrichum somersetense]